MAEFEVQLVPTLDAINDSELISYNRDKIMLYIAESTNSLAISVFGSPPRILTPFELAKEHDLFNYSLQPGYFDGRDLWHTTRSGIATLIGTPGVLADNLEVASNPDDRYYYNYFSDRTTLGEISNALAHIDASARWRKYDATVVTTLGYRFLAVIMGFNEPLTFSYPHGINQTVTLGLYPLVDTFNIAYSEDGSATTYMNSTIDRDLDAFSERLIYERGLKLVEFPIMDYSSGKEVRLGRRYASLFDVCDLFSPVRIPSLLLDRLVFFDNSQHNMDNSWDEVVNLGDIVAGESFFTRNTLDTGAVLAFSSDNPLELTELPSTTVLKPFIKIVLCGIDSEIRGNQPT